MINSSGGVARLIDHSLLHPALDDEALRKGCELAARFKVASVCIKPYGVGLAESVLEGTGVAVGTVVGFPHGDSATAVKSFEADHACREGAVELDMVVNIGKVLSADWEFVRADIAEVLGIARKHGSILKVIFENDLLQTDGQKIRLCEICGELRVDFVKTSTGYGFVKDEEGKYSYQGATDDDLRLMRKHSPKEVQIKAAGGVRTLDDVIRVHELGVTRIGASATEKILKEAKARFGK